MNMKFAYLFASNFLYKSVQKIKRTFTNCNVALKDICNVAIRFHFIRCTVAWIRLHRTQNWSSNRILCGQSKRYYENELQRRKIFKNNFSNFSSQIFSNFLLRMEDFTTVDLTGQPVIYIQSKRKGVKMNTQGKIILRTSAKKCRTFTSKHPPNSEGLKNFRYTEYFSSQLLSFQMFRLWICQGTWSQKRRTWFAWPSSDCKGHYR